MFRGVILAPDPEFSKAVERLALETRHVLVSRTLPGFPGTPYDFNRLFSSLDPEIILIENTDPEAGLDIAEKLREQSPRVAILALGGRVKPHMMKNFDDASVEVLNGAFTHDEFTAAIRSALHRVRRGPYPQLYAFLPAKAGSGATTTAFNVAAAVGSNLNKKVFLLEADLHSGVLSAMLDQPPPAALVDALQNSADIGAPDWPKYLISAHGVDFMVADRHKKAPLPSWMNYHQLLQFAVAHYETIVVDLPEVVNDATSELIQYANCVFVVCTPELTSLKLAEQRLDELVTWGAPQDRIQVIVNRWHKSDMPAEEVSELLKHPVSLVLRNDYRSVSRSISNSRPISFDTDLGRTFVDFGKRLMNMPVEEAPPARRFAFF